jgi:hypothetical protein
LVGALGLEPVMTRVRGTQKRVTLGRHPALKLAQARTLAREAIAEAQRAEEPSAAKRAARRPAERPVEQVIVDYVARATGAWAALLAGGRALPDARAGTLAWAAD